MIVGTAEKRKEGHFLSTQFNSNLEKIVQGKLQYKSDLLGNNLLISRLQRKYAADRTPQVLQECVREFNAFFEKYKQVSQKDIDAIQKL